MSLSHDAPHGGKLSPSPSAPIGAEQNMTSPTMANPSREERRAPQIPARRVEELREFLNCREVNPYEKHDEMADVPLANVLLMGFGSGEADPAVAILETLAEDLDVASVAINHDGSLRWDFVISSFAKRVRAVNELLLRKAELAQTDAVRASAEGGK
jgi:hypothetical protein